MYKIYLQKAYLNIKPGSYLDSAISLSRTNLITATHTASSAIADTNSSFYAQSK
jgi:hypothetical protein